MGQAKAVRKDGRVFIKVAGKWQAEHRLIAEFKILNRTLLPDEKVYRKDYTLRGKDGFNDDNNLVVIKCRTKKWAKPKTVLLPNEAKTEALVFK